MPRRAAVVWFRAPRWSPTSFRQSRKDGGGLGRDLLDVNLGNASGIELRHHLIGASISVPVIYMTGNDSPAVRTAALQSGCLAYLTKPFSAKSLREPLDEIASAA